MKIIYTHKQRQFNMVGIKIQNEIHLSEINV